MQSSERGTTDADATPRCAVDEAGVVREVNDAWLRARGLSRGEALGAHIAVLVPPPPRPRVLVVDDEPAVGFALRRVLAPAYDVEVLTRAEDALERIAGGERFAALICDLMMPGMNGIELFERVRELAPQQAERIAFITGGAFTEPASRFLAQTGNARIEKPFDAATVRFVIDGLVP